MAFRIIISYAWDRCYVTVTSVESLDEDWEKDFDVEVTEQELQAAKERLKNAASAATADDADAGKVCFELDAYYASTHLIDGTICIIFSGFPSVCACTYVPAYMHMSR